MKNIGTRIFNFLDMDLHIPLRDLISATRAASRAFGNDWSYSRSARADLGARYAGWNYLQELTAEAISIEREAASAAIRASEEWGGANESGNWITWDEESDRELAREAGQLEFTF